MKYKAKHIVSMHWPVLDPMWQYMGNSDEDNVLVSHFVANHVHADSALPLP